MSWTCRCELGDIECQLGKTKGADYEGAWE